MEVVDGPGTPRPSGRSAVTVTAEGMRAFRSAATLVDVLPRVRIQVNDGSRTLMTVSHALGSEKGGGMVMAPCPFRVAVAHAYHRMRCHHARFRFLDLPEDSEPSIHIGLPAGDQVLPGFIYRARAANDHHLFLFLSELTPSGCSQAVAGAVDATVDPDPIGFRRRIGFHHDRLTELTVVHTLAADRDRHAAGELMSRLLEICVTAEVVADIETVPPSARGAAS